MAAVRAVPLVLWLAAATVFIGVVSWIAIAQAGKGFVAEDFVAYDSAARRWLGGGSLYDPRAIDFGAPGAFFYPPPFAILLLPFALLPVDVAIWVWLGTLVLGSLAAFALMPVSRAIRVAMVMLATVSWPMVYAIKLGQVGPLLMLLVVIGWRSLDSPGRFGVAAALGAITKIQPIILTVWAVLAGRLRAAAVSVAILAGLSILATIAMGPPVWLDFAQTLLHASSTIPVHDVGVERVLLDAGFPEMVARSVQAVHIVVAAAVIGSSVRLASPTGSFLAFAVGSQLLSVVLWDHYALILLVPVAWLLSRGVIWAAVIPLATSIFSHGASPPLTYPVAFWVTLLAVIWQGRIERREQVVAPTVAAGEPEMLRGQATRLPDANLVVL